MSIMHRIKQSKLMIFGFALGVVFCTGLLVGYTGQLLSGGQEQVASNDVQALLASSGNQPLPADLERMLLKADSADSTDTMAMATGPVEEGVEGLYVLDFQTGDLYCWVVSPRGSGWIAEFKTNVIAHFGGIDKGKEPKYVMTTGFWNPRGRSGQGQPSKSVCYVADANSGKLCAFSFFWNEQAAAQGATQTNELLKIAEAVTRNPNLERN